MRIDPKIKQLPTFGSHFQLQVQVLPLSDVETDQNITYPPKKLGYTDEIICNIINLQSFWKIAVIQQ